MFTEIGVRVVEGVEEVGHLVREELRQGRGRLGSRGRPQVQFEVSVRKLFK